ncbi:acyl carrier protein [Amycolatopsis cihanbeyliensis]|uniref:Acyl carrier protein n=1 Tax=Amycolatopsis cihanbeyliensis TaxID=1128664 RepID=A0A542DJK3_AMYCI|nr:acyl carrier protein [Amycolatopsis cihanbeyliensis]TQJ03135.1 acyl carrier protein [Amycolatopsis cihanbeyliensis]
MATDEAAGVGPHLTELKRLVCDSFLIDPDRLDASTPLADVGIDSKKRVQLLATLEIHYDVRIDLEERERMQDLTGVAEVLTEALRGKATSESG